MASLQRLAGTGANYGSSDIAWSNPNEVTAVDGVAATCAISLVQQSRPLRATNFGFTIPSAGTVTGIAFTVRLRASLANGLKDRTVMLVLNGSTIGTAKTRDVYWPTSFTDVTFGGAGDLWGASLTPAQVNDATFGLTMGAGNMNQPSTTTAYIDAIWLTVYYTEPVYPSGIESAGQAGTVSISASGTHPLTGASALTSVGSVTVTPTVNVSASGPAAVGYIGAVSTLMETPVPVAGVSALAQVGAVNVPHTVAFTTTPALTSQVGQAQAFQGVIFEPASVSATTTMGAVNVVAIQNLTHTPSGVVAATATGTVDIITDAVAMPSGASAACTVGHPTIRVDYIVPVSGVSATATTVGVTNWGVLLTPAKSAWVKEKGYH